MQQIDVVFSISVHENIGFLQKQLENILRYNPHSHILLHLSANMDDETTKEGLALGSDKISFTKRRMHTAHCNILHVIVSLLEEASSIDCEYICLLSSNVLFFKHNSIEYMKKFAYGSSKFRNRSCPHTNELIYLLGANPEIIHSIDGQHEGMFFTRKLAEDLAKAMLKFRNYDGLQKLEIIGASEETYLQTAIHIIAGDKLYGLPIVIMPNVMSYHRIDKNPVWTTEDIIKFASNMPKTMPYHTREEESTDSFFACKTVRDINNPLFDIF